MEINIFVVLISLLLAYLLFFLVTKSIKLVGKVILVIVLAYLIYPYIQSILN